MASIYFGDPPHFDGYWRIALDMVYGRSDGLNRDVRLPGENIYANI